MWGERERRKPASQRCNKSPPSEQGPRASWPLPGNPGDKRSAHVGEPRDQLLDFDRDAVSADHHEALVTGKLLARIATSSSSEASSSMMAPRPSRSTWCTGMVVVPRTTWISRATLSSVGTCGCPCRRGMVSLQVTYEVVKTGQNKINALRWLTTCDRSIVFFCLFSALAN